MKENKLKETHNTKVTEGNPLKLEKALESIKSKTFQVSFGWALATLITVAVGYNTLYTKFISLIDQSSEIEKLSNKILILEHKFEYENKQYVKYMELLDDYNKAHNRQSQKYAFIPNVNNCDSLNTAIKDLQKKAIENNCH